MPFNQVDLSLPGDFSGEVRLFPLPDLVVFPGVMQGLHIFEPRYIQMMRDALASDQLITMATLKPGWENESPGSRDPEIYSTVCIGKIVTHSRRQDGRYNMLLTGSSRAKIVQEIAGDTPYRRAEVEIIEDVGPAETMDLEQQTKHLAEVFRKYIALHPGFGQSTLGESVESLPPGLMADLICYSASLDAVSQIEVLELSDVVARIERVSEMISKKNESTHKVIDSSQSFPPDFSSN